jgi:hypothetical protein
VDPAKLTGQKKTEHQNRGSSESSSSTNQNPPLTGPSSVSSVPLLPSIPMHPSSGSLSSGSSFLPGLSMPSSSSNANPLPFAPTSIAVPVYSTSSSSSSLSSSSADDFNFDFHAEHLRLTGEKKKALEQTKMGQEARVIRTHAFENESLSKAQSHLGKKVKLPGEGAHAFSSDDVDTAIKQISNLSADTEATPVMRHDFQNHKKPADTYANYQLQWGGSAVYYKKPNTSATNVVVDKGLLDHPDILKKVKEAHKQSYNTASTVIISTGDESGHEFIKGRLPEKHREKWEKEKKAWLEAKSDEDLKKGKGQKEEKQEKDQKKPGKKK